MREFMELYATYRYWHRGQHDETAAQADRVFLAQFDWLMRTNARSAEAAAEACTAPLVRSGERE